jgi:DNA-directed RNA polymerase subunit RPC12/RpoP
MNLVEVFSPPSYKCVTCKDTRVAGYRIWVKQREDPSSYDKSFNNMPVVDLPCDKCKSKLHTKLKEEKEIELNNNAEIKL